MSRIHRDMSVEELGAAVCTALERHGISVVLSGGAVVSIYSDNEYESPDLDFIQTGMTRRVDATMKELGFVLGKGRHWEHPHTSFIVEFPSGPVMVGEDHVTEFAERRTRAGRLRLLHPTECVMDRLAWYFHARDPQSLDQAVAVARRHAVDLERIEEWCGRQGPKARFGDFLERLKKAS